MVLIRPMEALDIDDVARVHSEVFIRQSASRQWLGCNFKAYPRIMMFVAEDEQKHIVGYIQWLQKSGFRKEAVIELEQIAVLPDYQGRGIGGFLISESLNKVAEYLTNHGSQLKSVLITTRSDNSAQRLYKKVLNADVVGIVKNLYSHDEVIMLARLK